VAVYALGDRLPIIHPDAFVHPDATVIGDVTIGAGSTVWPAAVLRGDYGAIVVGERTSIQDGTVVHATADKPTHIGRDCVIGHLAHLEGCTVEDRCLIGSGSVVLHDVVVRSGALVGAGAVVSNGTQVPPLCTRPTGTATARSCADSTSTQRWTAPHGTGPRFCAQT